MTRPQAIQTARRMWADGDGGWTITEIRDYLAERGQSVLWETIKAWVDPEWGAKRRAKNREKQRRRYRERHGVRTYRVLDDHALGNLPSATPDLLLALRVEDGLPYSAIAKVATRLLGEPMTEQQARYRLLKLGAAKNEKKAAHARAQARRRHMKVAA